jgi:hypothetical protein
MDTRDEVLDTMIERARLGASRPLPRQVVALIAETLDAGIALGAAQEREAALNWMGTFPETSSVRLLMSALEEGKHCVSEVRLGGAGCASDHERAASMTMRVSHDPAGRTILVCLHRGWMLFRYSSDLKVEDMSANARYMEVITGVPNVGGRARDAAWDAARSAFSDLSAVPTATHGPFKTQITVGVARHLAGLDRIKSRGGFHDDHQSADRLTIAEQRAVARRLRGLVVL